MVVSSIPVSVASAGWRELLDGAGWQHPARGLLRHPDDLVADDGVREAEGPVDVGHGPGLGGDLEEDVGALRAVRDLVREAALAPLVHAIDRGATRRQLLGAAVDH